MLKEETLDKEMKRLRKLFETLRNSGNPSELAFIEGAISALEWMKTRIVRYSPSKFIEWRRGYGDPYK